MTCFHKFSHIFDLILPVLEGQVDIATQFFDDLLGGWRVTDNFHFLGVKIVNSVFDAFDLVKVPGFFFSGVETNQSFKNFVAK